MSQSTSGVSTTLIRAQYEARRALSIATRAIPSAILWLAPIVGWATAAVFLGAAVGLSAVILPPTGAFAVPAIAALLLLWALPELPAVPVRTVRALFPIVLVVDLCVPVYYAIAGTGLPWISVRRIATFPLILCISLVIAGSSEARARIVRRLGAAKVVSTCVIGYGVMTALSIFTSAAPPASISGVVDAVLIWYVPFITIIYLTSDERDIDKFLKIIAWCTVFVSVCGLVDWVLERNIFVAILPAPILNALMENSPTFAAMATTNMYHLGEYRAPSVFENALSFGQFEAMIIPFGYYFLVHRRGGDQWLGLLVVASGLLGVITSGARGAYVALLAATPAFAALWALRRARFHPRSLGPALVGVAGVSGFAGLIILTFTWIRTPQPYPWPSWRPEHPGAMGSVAHGAAAHPSQPADWAWSWHSRGRRGLFQSRSPIPNPGQHAHIPLGRDRRAWLSFFLRVSDFRDCSRRQEISAGFQRSRGLRRGIVLQPDCFPGLFHRAVAG